MKHEKTHIPGREINYFGFCLFTLSLLMALAATFCYCDTSWSLSENVLNMMILCYCVNFGQFSTKHTLRGASNVYQQALCFYRKK